MRNESGFSPVGVNQKFYPVGVNQKFYPVGANQPEAIRDNPIAISLASWLNSSHKVQVKLLKCLYGVAV